MSNTPRFLGREPVLWMIAAQALIALAIAFGVDLTADQVAAVMAAIAGVLGLIVRSRVTPVLPD